MPFPDEWRKRGYAKQLKALVKQYKENNPNMNAEQLARKYGHTILRLPRNCSVPSINIPFQNCSKLSMLCDGSNPISSNIE